MHAYSELDLKPGNKHRPEKYSRAIPKAYAEGFDAIEFPTQRRKREELERRLAEERAEEAAKAAQKPAEGA